MTVQTNIKSEISFHIQEDCCDNQLNITPILTLNIDTVTNNTVHDMSVNIQSVIDNTMLLLFRDVQQCFAKGHILLPYNHIP